MKIDVPKTMARRTIIPGRHERVSISVEEYKQRNAYIWEAQDAASQRCGIKILNPIPYLCSDDTCFGDRNGTPIFADDDHLNEYGGDTLIPMFSEVFTTQAGQQISKHP